MLKVGMEVAGAALGLLVSAAAGLAARFMRLDREEEARRRRAKEEKARRRREEEKARRQREEEKARRQREEEKARRQREEEKKARRQREEEKARRRRLGLLVVCSFVCLLLFVCLIVSYYRGNIMSSDPVQEKSVNLMTQTDQRHVMEQYHQSEQTEREQKKNSQQAEQTGGDQGDDERDDEDKERDQEKEESDSEEEESDSEEEEEINQTPPGTIRLGLLNVHSMNPRRSRISELITGNNLDVLLTTETWLRDDTLDTVLREASPPEGFSFHSQVRTDGRRGGGVANQFSERLQGEQIHFDSLNIETFEFVVTELQHNDWDQPVVIINLYHPPGYNQQRFRRFQNEFESLLDEVKKKYSSIIVAGDFNIRPKKGKRSYTDEFYQVWQLYNLEQHVKEPTHIAGNTLDLVLTTNVEISGVCVHGDTDSDHYTIYFNAKPKDTGKKTENEEQKRFRQTGQ